MRLAAVWAPVLMGVALCGGCPDGGQAPATSQREAAPTGPLTLQARAGVPLETEESPRSGDRATLHSNGTFLEVEPHEGGVLFLGRAREAFRLTDEEIERLHEAEVAASTRLQYPSYTDGYLEVFRHDLPVLITLDSLLHAWHMTYDDTLVRLETQVLMGLLRRSLDDLARTWRPCPTSGAACEAWADVDVYVAVARSLLAGEPRPPSDAANGDAVTEILSHAATEGPADIDLYGRTRRADFGQLRPIGHYDRSPELSRWFRAVRWLELYGFNAAVRRGESMVVDQRGLLASLVLTRMLRDGAEWESWTRLEDALIGLVGAPDGLSPDGMDELLRERKWDSLEALATTWELLPSLSEELASRRYGQQALRTAGGPPRVDADGADILEFHMTPARYALDSALLARLVTGGSRTVAPGLVRDRPHPIDVLAALGNSDAEAALPLAGGYAERLEAAKAEVAAVSDSFWTESIYNSWLWTLRSLNNSDVAELPSDFNTTGWKARRLHTQLASWTQLRHDNVLYVPPVMGGVVMCEYPDVVVDPYPQAFRRLAAMAELLDELYLGTTRTAAFGVSSPASRIAEAARRLAGMAERQLAGHRIDPADHLWVQSMFDAEWVHGACSRTLAMNGWFIRLFPDRKSALEPDRIAAPVFVAGRGADPVLELGTGDVHLVLSVVERPDGPTLVAGPIQSVHSSWQPRPRKDSEWEAEYLRSQPPTPSWESALWKQPAVGSRGRGGPARDGLQGD